MRNLIVLAVVKYSSHLSLIISLSLSRRYSMILYHKNEISDMQICCTSFQSIDKENAFRFPVDENFDNVWQINEHFCMHTHTATKLRMQIKFHDIEMSLKSFLFVWHYVICDTYYSNEYEYDVWVWRNSYACAQSVIKIELRIDLNLSADGRIFALFLCICAQQHRLPSIEIFNSFVIVENIGQTEDTLGI